jgi:hypothetical protein
MRCPTAKQTTMSELPYEIDAKYDLFAVLGHPHEIPYHSRPFMWTRDNYIEHVVTQAVRKFRTSQQHWLGFLIINLGGPIPAITDAQHRLTVYLLMLLACARILERPKHLSKISQYGHDDDDLPSAADAAILDKYQWAHIPNIRSVYTHDFEALGNVLNDVPIPAEADTHSRIYDAYAAVHTLLLSGNLLSQEELGPFLTFITKNTKVSRVRITDWNFTLEVFDSFNNIKVTVPPVYLLKNVLVRHGGKGHGEEIHTAFQRWEAAVGVGAPFEQFMHVVGNLFVGSWNKSDRYVHAMEAYLAAMPQKGFHQFAEFVNKGISMRTWLSSNMYARLLNRVASGHEVMDYCVLPLLMSADTPVQVEGLIRRLLAFGLRTRDRFSFNGRERFDALIGKDGVISAFIAGRTSLRDSIKAIDQLLLGWLGVEPEAEFIRRVEIESYKTGAAFNRARVALLYIAEMTDKHEATLDHAVIDIDHVSPRAPRKGDPLLADPELTHRIGNFTPFIGKNSATLRGNRGFGNKPYTEKREAYAASNIAMTRAISSRYAVFDDAAIQERSRELAVRLNAITTKELTSTQ